MNTELIDISPTRKEIKIEIEPQAVKQAYDKVSRKYAQGAQVAGFRKGNAPLDVVRMRYKEEIKSETLQEIVAEKVTEAIREHDLTPLVQPELHLDDAENLKLNGSQPVTLHAHIEVMPEIPNPEYKGLEATRRVKPVDDAELDKFIDERRQQQSSLIPVEGRKSENGDTVIVDLEGSFPDEPDGAPVKADDLEITLGDANIEKSFTENLADVEADEEKEFTVTYEPTFSSPALAGKTVRYKAKIKSIGKIELPEADDEWAQSLGEDFESMQDLRSKLRSDMEVHSTADADAAVQNALIAKLIENHAFEVPNALIENQARNLLNNFVQDMQQRGVDINKVEQEFVRMAYEQMRGQAERDVRGAMLLEKVAEMENIDVSGDEVAQEIERVAQYYRTTPEEIRKSLSQQGGEENIANSLRTRKAVEALVTNAKVTDGEWIDENQAALEAASAEEKAEKPAKEKKPKAAKKTSEPKEAKEPKEAGKKAETKSKEA
ncbi:MAG TPA: trigger factor [Pyrinomonadaceae bacterium]|nr:trigger factor [Pyrinomonadaceae bacterium]